MFLICRHWWRVTWWRGTYDDVANDDMSFDDISWEMMRGLKYNIDYITRVILSKMMTWRPMTCHRSHDMSLDDMSPYGPYDIRLWALHFDWAKRLKTRGPLVDLVYKDLILWKFGPKDSFAHFSEKWKENPLQILSRKTGQPFRNSTLNFVF